jgi:hypothetical protein
MAKLVDDVVHTIMGFVPDTVRHMLRVEHDYRSTPPSVQVIDLR